MITGTPDNSERKTVILRNLGDGIFEEDLNNSAVIVQAMYGGVSWADYDGDWCVSFRLFSDRSRYADLQSH